MVVKNPGHLIDRWYSETADHQWLRELFVNSVEAGATRALLGVEWEAAESLGVYRRMFACDGSGMTRGDLERYFSSLGDGAKAIGNPDENFGIGAKVTLLPWNKHGLVVISYKDGESWMMRFAYDPSTNRYGPTRFNAIDDTTGIEQTALTVPPFPDAESGCDWSTVAPDFVREAGHGTVVVMMGDSAESDTVLGAPGRAESAIKSASKYLNERFLERPIAVKVEELNNSDKADWPRSKSEAQEKSDDDQAHRTNLREIKGALHFIKYPKSRTELGNLASSGTTVLSDGTEVDHYLWAGDRPKVGDYASKTGFIAVEYKAELYHRTTHYNRYRSWGIGPSTVRRNLTLIARPPQRTGDDPTGVYPGSGRSALLYGTRTQSGLELVEVMNRWAEEWADSMPQDIVDAIRDVASSRSGSTDDPNLLERLVTIFGDRWKVGKVDTRRAGDQTNPSPLFSPSCPNHAPRVLSSASRNCPEASCS